VLGGKHRVIPSTTRGALCRATRDSTRGGWSRPTRPRCVRCAARAATAHGVGPSFASCRLADSLVRPVNRSRMRARRTDVAIVGIGLATVDNRGPLTFSHREPPARSGHEWPNHQQRPQRGERLLASKAGRGGRDRSATDEEKGRWSAVFRTTAFQGGRLVLGLDAASRCGCDVLPARFDRRRVGPRPLPRGPVARIM